MATEVVNSIKTGGDYTTVGSWESTTQGDLMAADEVRIGEIYLSDSPYDQDGIAIGGATVDSTRYRVLRAAASEKHTGKRNTGARIHSDIGAFGGVIVVNEDYVQLVDLEMSGGTKQMYGIYQNGANTALLVENCIVFECGFGGMEILGGGTIRNCIVHHCGMAAASAGGIRGVSADNSLVIVQHCTVIRLETDVNIDNTGIRWCIIQNCAVFHHGGSGGHKDILNAHATSTNNATSDDSGDDVGPSGQINLTATDEFVSVASGSTADFHIKSTSLLAASGSGIAAVPTDIDGQARNSTFPDVGADEFLFGGTPVQVTDPELVALYRFRTFSPGAQEVLLNQSESPAYSGLNTMSVSGTAAPEMVLGPGSGVPGAPSSSGARISGSATELFHLPYSPAQSGNASGLEISTTQDFSFGGWFMNQFAGDFKTMMSKWTLTGTGRHYEFQARTGTAPARFWRVKVPSSAGATANNIDSPFVAGVSEWEHVVCTINANSGTDNVRLYVSGVLVSSGSVTISPGASGTHPGFRLGNSWPAGSEGLANALGSSNGGQLAEIFLMRRILVADEVLSVYQSGFQGGGGGPAVVSGSDANDLQKDNTPGTSSPAGAPVIRITAWNAIDGANPSGYRHIESGIHPAFIKRLDTGSVSGLVFTGAVKGNPSDPKVLTIFNETVGTQITNLKLWLSDLSTFAGESDYYVATVNSGVWVGGSTLVVGSGTGTVPSAPAGAVAILRSDGFASISGMSRNPDDTLDEGDISQYVYLAFDTGPDFNIGEYGFTGFRFRLTMAYEEV